MSILLLFFGFYDQDIPWRTDVYFTVISRVLLSLVPPIYGNEKCLLSVHVKHYDLILRIRVIFDHLKLWIAVARHNFKLLKM